MKVEGADAKDVPAAGSGAAAVLVVLLAVVAGAFWRLAPVGGALLFGDELARTTDHLIEPGKTYHVVAEKRGDRIRLLVDGREVVSAEGCRPIRGGSFGLYVWNSGRIDNVKITQIPGTE